MDNIRELIRQSYKDVGLREISEDYLDGIMADKIRVEAFKEILGIKEEVA